MNYDKSNNQRGGASIVVTIVMLSVITLIVVGFTQVANRNRREALDRQLSTQAFYAAESGVNAAMKILENRLAMGDPIVERTECGDTSNGYDLLNLNDTNKLSTDLDVQYTCVLVNPVNESLRFAASTSTSTAFAIKPVNNAANNTPGNLKQMKVTWSPPAGITPSNLVKCGTGSSFPPNDVSYKDCGYGVVRLDLLQNKPSFSSGTDLLDNTLTFYLKPNSNNSNIAATISDFDTGLNPQRGNIVLASCDNVTTNTCTATINFSGNATSNSKEYYGRLSMLYMDSPTVEITGTLTNNTSAFFNGGQVLIDSTGKAQDVLRRVQARVTLSPFGDATPNGAIMSGSGVCKRYVISSTSYLNEDLSNPKCL